MVDLGFQVRQDLNLKVLSFYLAADAHFMDAFLDRYRIACVGACSWTPIALEFPASEAASATAPLVPDEHHTSSQSWQMLVLRHPNRRKRNLQGHLCSRHHTPRSDLIISVSGEQRLAVRTPRQAHTFRLPALLSFLNIFWLQLIHLALLLKIKDCDAGCCCGAEPVSVRREDKCMDFIAGLEGVEVFRFIEIPQHSCAVFTTGSAKRAVRRDGDSVDVACMANMVGLDAARSKFPDLAWC